MSTRKKMWDRNSRETVLGSGARYKFCAMNKLFLIIRNRYTSPYWPFA